MLLIFQRGKFSKIENRLEMLKSTRYARCDRTSHGHRKARSVVQDGMPKFGMPKLTEASDTALSAFLLRNCTSSRRPSRPSSILYPPLRPITLRCGRRLHPRTATSARGCCGASPGRECAAPSAASSATRSARTCSMQTVYKVRDGNWKDDGSFMSLCKVHFPGVGLYEGILILKAFQGASSMCADMSFLSEDELLRYCFHVRCVVCQSCTY